MGELKPESVSGTILIIPIASVEAFYKRSVFVHPFDGKNLNTVFPGTENGTMSERIAHFISREIIPASDVLLDIHGGDASEELLPFVCYYDRVDAKEQTLLAKKLCEVSGFKYVVSYPYNLSASEPAKYAFKQAVQHGITALSIEAGELGNIQVENVSNIKSAIYNMLSQLKVYTNYPDRITSAQHVSLNRQEYIRVPEKGIFYSDYRAGDTVKKGAVLGWITDEFGKKLTEILSPKEGIILYKVGTPPVNPGETLFCIGFSE
ncbi:Succinylglutamate desuccinylase / Aspartoacylase family protein [compost metagenome]